ncbi:unnamed protein product [Orchesella dallaii]|uniref:BTB domain-containing protein n=1 Tax=Orchesella dallaii TaxID=48710 RepID=A0ABP1RT03_9HEXA
MEDENQFNVRWNDHTTVLLQSITKKLEQNEFTDVVLACEGQSLQCHRLILSACSPYFEKMLAETNIPNMVIFLKDTKFWELEALVNFMYRGEITVTQEKLAELCRAAEQLKVRGLAKNVDSGFGTGITEGDLRGMEQHLDYTNIRDMVMVDLLHYGNGNSAEANQKQRPAAAAPEARNHKSLLRPPSNVPPATRKLQEFFKRSQQTQLEAPKPFKVPKIGKQSTGYGVPPNGSNGMSVKAKACATATKAGPNQPSSGGCNEGKVIVITGSSPQNGGAINPVPKLGGEGAVKYGGATTTPEGRMENLGMTDVDIERMELHFVNNMLQISDSTANAMTSAAAKTSPSGSSTEEGNRNSSSSTPSPPTNTSNGMGPTTYPIGRVNLMEQAANRAVVTRNIRQAAKEYEIPRSTLNAYMKRKKIVIRLSETQDVSKDENPSMSSMPKGDFNDGSDRDQVKSMTFYSNHSGEGENGSADVNMEDILRTSFN